jgi:hypothetical protein
LIDGSVVSVPIAGFSSDFGATPIWGSNGV